MVKDTMPPRDCDANLWPKAAVDAMAATAEARVWARSRIGFERGL